MTQANKQTTTQSTAHFGAKATGKAKPVKTRPITRPELTETLDAIREKDQPVLDYLAKKPIETRRITRAELMASIEASREKNQPVLDYLKDK